MGSNCCQKTWIPGLVVVGLPKKSRTTLAIVASSSLQGMRTATGSRDPPGLLDSSLMTEQTDRKYYQIIRKGGVAERLLVSARDRIYADLIRACDLSPASTILDVGVSTSSRRRQSSERSTPFGKDHACGPGRHQVSAGLSGPWHMQIERPLPSATAIRICPHQTPFWSTSAACSTRSASNERVGSGGGSCLRPQPVLPRRAPHRHPLSALGRMGRFTAACAALGKSEWRQERNLILMTRRRLAELLPGSRQWTIGYTGVAARSLKLQPFAVSRG